MHEDRRQHFHLKADNNIIMKKKISKWISENRSKSYMYTRLNLTPHMFEKYLKETNISYKGNRGNKGIKRLCNSKVFCRRSNVASQHVSLRIRQDNLLPFKCCICGISEWQNKELKLEIDHINGSGQDNRLTNLRFLCPNCHSQTDTFRGRGINVGVKKFTDEELLAAIKAHERVDGRPNIRQALMSLNMAAKGGNYERANRLYYDK